MINEYQIQCNFLFCIKLLTFLLFFLNIEKIFVSLASMSLIFITEKKKKIVIRRVIIVIPNFLGGGRQGIFLVNFERFYLKEKITYCILSYIRVSQIYLQIYVNHDPLCIKDVIKSNFLVF